MLVYGENIGLKEALKKKITSLNSKAEVINLYQEDITKNKDIILNEVQNISLFSEEKIKMAIQINGKTRDVVEIEKGKNQILVEKLCKNNAKIKDKILSKSIIKIIFVKDRIINFIVK